MQQPVNYQLLSFLNLGKYIIRKKKTSGNWPSRSNFSPVRIDKCILSTKIFNKNKNKNQYFA